MASLKNKRVLMVCRTMEIGGTEKVVLQLCEAFANEFGFLAVASSGGRLETQLHELGIPHFLIPDVAVKQLRAAKEIVRSLRDITCRYSINMVHSHHRMAALYSSIALPACEHFVTAHNVFLDKKMLTRAAYHGAHVVACGKRVEDNLVNYYGLKDVTLIPNSVKSFSGSVSDIPEISACPKGTLRIGFLGRFCEQKGVRYLVDAINILAERGLSIHCFLAGEGELEDELVNKVEASGHSDAFTFLGRRDDAQNYLSQLDICVMPSLWEGLPLVLLEAFSVGTPVIASAVDGIMDVVKDGENGSLVRAGDAVALSHAIESIYQQPCLRRSLAVGCEKTFRSEFSYELWVSKYSDLYQGKVGINGRAVEVH